MGARAARATIALVSLLLLGCGARTPLEDELAGRDAGSGADDGSSFVDGADGSFDDDASIDPDGSIGRDASRRDSSALDASPPTCDLSCMGCCSGTTCVPLAQETAGVCGFGGNCTTCMGPGARCFKGSCVSDTSNCGSSNCPGCCFSSTLCADGISERGCGVGGEACVSCFGTTTPKCVPQSGGGGLCGSTAHCDPATCHGCCDGTTCQLGTSDGACGMYGDTCSPCGAGQSCIDFGGGGMCESPPFCTFPACSVGCCSGNRCAPGGEDSACGVGGGACMNCASHGKVCVNGQCVVGCNPSICAGCCQGNLCAVGDQAFACGSGGAACVDCTALHGSCVSHSCH